MIRKQTLTPRLTAASQDLVDRMVRVRRAPLHLLTPESARAVYAAGAEIMEMPQPSLPRIEDFFIPARDGHALPARLYAPEPTDSGGVWARNLPALVYFHGGGFVVGSIATHDTLCRRLAQLAGCAVVSVDYRLAPEHPFPTAVHDAWDALQWLGEHGGTRCLDTDRLAVGGDSAGGTLAAVCAVLAKDAGLRLVLQLLLYPGCSGDHETPSRREFGAGFVLETAQIAWFFHLYARNVTDRADWRFAPLNAPDVEGVAPAWMGLAECDPLVDEGVLYADKMRAQGVAVDLEIYRGVTHEFIKMGRFIPEAHHAHGDAGRALKTAFERP